MGGFPPWLNVDFENQMHLGERWRELRWSLASEKEHPWHRRAYAMLTSSYCASLLEGEDAANTGFALEARMPFMDLRVQRFLLRTPPLPLCIEKELLRRAAGDLLPERIRSRPKKPLAGDPLNLQTKHIGWSPIPLIESLERVATFVNCSNLGTLLRGGEGVSLWRDIRPFSLEYWLKRMENVKLSPSEREENL